MSVTRVRVDKAGLSLSLFKLYVRSTKKVSLHGIASQARFALRSPGGPGPYGFDGPQQNLSVEVDSRHATLKTMYHIPIYRGLG